ncbi:hypothetical protein [Micromonospora okii]|uniref:hypothetical protein n=1 Tax=Micromonospora okii TaxID=1182970 RepID=UPI001E469079|nr:hypothetical protein [Micromonospora okii]
MRERLPPGWSIELDEKVDQHRIDGIADLKAPDGTKAALIIEAKRSVVTGDLAGALDRLRSHSLPHVDNPVLMIAARYLGSSARAWLEERGVSYADATGNMHVLLERPAMYLHDRGADRDPWRGPGRPRGTLQGQPAACVVRALVDTARPMTVPELIRASGASTGATYRVVEFLEREALVRRDPGGPLVDVEWRRILERWSEDYGFQRSNSVAAYLNPRGLAAFQESLRYTQGIRYALTGSLAAHRLAPYAPAKLAMVYVDDLDEAAERLGLRQVDSGANVLVAHGKYDVVFDRVVQDDGLTYVAPSQAAVDLLTGPGRSPAEGHELLDWMEKHERVWRR